MKIHNQHKIEFCIGTVVTAVLLVTGIVLVAPGIVLLIRGIQDDVFAGIMLTIFGSIPLIIGVSTLFSFCCVYGYATRPVKPQNLIVVHADRKQVEKDNCGVNNNGGDHVELICDNSRDCS